MAETKQIEALFGPYSGLVLTMPAADAEQAIADGWGGPLRSAPLDANAPAARVLTMAEREAAEAAAAAWAAKVRGETPAGKDAPAGGKTARDLKPDEGERGAYQTKGEPRTK